MCRVDLFSVVRGCGAIAQWLEHLCAKREALGSIPSAMYSVKYKTCSGEYVGETLCVLRVRKKEHCDAIRRGQSSKSAIAKHVHEQSMPHEIDWQGMKAIDRAR